MRPQRKARRRRHSSAISRSPQRCDAGCSAARMPGDFGYTTRGYMADKRTEGRGLATKLTQYGDAGFARFLREAFLKASGLSEDAFNRPVIGIASTASDFNPCHATAPALIEAIKRGIT